MDRAKVSDDFKSIVEEVKDIDREKIVDKATRVDLGIDSLDVVEIVMLIEKKFGYEIPDEDAVKLETVGETIDYILKKSK